MYYEHFKEGLSMYENKTQHGYEINFGIFHILATMCKVYTNELRKPVNWHVSSAKSHKMAPKHHIRGNLLGQIPAYYQNGHKWLV